MLISCWKFHCSLSRMPKSRSHHCSLQLTPGKVCLLFLTFWDFGPTISSRFCTFVHSRIHIWKSNLDSARTWKYCCSCCCCFIADIPEQNVSLTKPDMSPAERVQEAVVCLPARLESVLADPPSPGFRRWTIRDFTSAYISGEITPVMVKHFVQFYWQ